MGRSLVWTLVCVEIAETKEASMSRPMMKLPRVGPVLSVFRMGVEARI
jgi:hypothetical protein